jgi:DHA1 family bicyclomycin/chloramphenicol resistance-like MFS transporter
MTFIFLACVGISNPNASALALAPFTKNAGSAAALLGAIQLGTGAAVSTSIGILKATSSLPIVGILFATALAGLLVFLVLKPRPQVGVQEDV